MINLIFIVLLIVGFYLDEVGTSHYKTLAEAEADNLFLRGWLPEILPPSATNIKVTTDLDSNLSWGSFEFAPQDYFQLQYAASTYEVSNEPFTRFTDKSKNHIKDGYPVVRIQKFGSKWLFLCKPEIGSCKYILEPLRSKK